MTVPVPPDLFVGLVTHPGTRYPDASGETGLGPTVVRTLRERGRGVAWHVSADDAWTPALLPIDRDQVRASVRAELDVEGRWRAYIAGRSLPLADRLLLAVRRAKRTWDLAPPWRQLQDDDPGFRSVRRLANIELSHMRLLREAVAAQPTWALIIEDDAGAPDPALFAQELDAFLTDRADDSQPVMVSLSESFTPAQLGIEHLLSPIHERVPGVTWSLWESQRPVTNTVCATLYRGDFLQRLMAELERIPLSPVVPIDFKVNEALMQVAQQSTPGDCWIAHPAPLTQRSGVPEVRR